MVKLNNKQHITKNGVVKKNPISKNVRPFINTAMGVAKYVKTEVEDKFERWNDNYYTRDGYYVIHEGSKHHIYKVK